MPSSETHHVHGDEARLEQGAEKQQDHRVLQNLARYGRLTNFRRSLRGRVMLRDKAGPRRHLLYILDIVQCGKPDDLVDHLA